MTRKKGIRRILELAMRSPVWMMLAVILAILSSVSVLVPYHAILGIVKGMVIKQSESGEIYRYGIEAFGGAAFQIVTYFASLSCSHMAAFETERSLKMEAVGCLEEVSMGFLTDIGQGKLVHIIDDASKEVQSFLAHEIPEIILSIVTPISVLAMMFWVNWCYALVIMLIYGIIYWFQILSNGPGGASEMMSVYLTALDRLHNETVEYIRGIRELRLYGQGKEKSGSLHETIREYTKVCIPYTIIWEKYRSLLIGVLHNIYLFLIPAGILLLGKRALSVHTAEFVYFLLLSTVSVVLIPRLEGLTNHYLRVVSVVEQLDDFLYQPKMAQPEASVLPASASLSFHNVCFSYEKGRQVLDHITFQAEPGSITALVGSSGSGKTTVLKMLARFQDLDEGNIRIGGVDIRDLTLKDLMAQISCVFQTPYIFHQSIEENIRGGNRNASIEEVQQAAKRAGCHSFIERLPDGYQTILREEGQLLSGGEIQRLAIARAILKNAPIVLLDEVTSAADPENELQIQMAIHELAKGKTVLVAAHRLPSIKNADQILVMEQGKIIERGTHQELLEMRGRYEALWNAYTEILNWRIGDRER